MQSLKIKVATITTTALIAAAAALCLTAYLPSTVASDDIAAKAATPSQTPTVRWKGRAAIQLLLNLAREKGLSASYRNNSNDTSWSPLTRNTPFKPDGEIMLLGSGKSATFTVSFNPSTVLTTRWMSRYLVSIRFSTGSNSAVFRQSEIDRARKKLENAFLQKKGQTEKEPQPTDTRSVYEKYAGKPGLTAAEFLLLLTKAGGEIVSSHGKTKGEIHFIREGKRIDVARLLNHGRVSASELKRVWEEVLRKTRVEFLLATRLAGLNIKPL